VLERIRREGRLVRQARADNDPREDFLQGFIKPLEGPITGVYGSQRVYNGVPKNPHYGLDIARPTGTVVVAPAPGIVKLVHDDMYYSGGTLVLDHGYGLSSSFIHLSGALVKEGQRVEAGDAIAKVGATGRATGPHLDWRVNWFNVRLDPALVLKFFPAAKGQ
jgi:murein DD-endopeptidase MepM/ murein hydrolase activator NlpD